MSRPDPARIEYLKKNFRRRTKCEKAYWKARSERQTREINTLPSLNLPEMVKLDPRGRDFSSLKPVDFASPLREKVDRLLSGKIIHVSPEENNLLFGAGR